jgi:perosamine synthetase
MSNALSSNNFPRPAIPLSPVLSTRSLGASSSEVPVSSILDCRNYIQLTSGRAAISLALEHAGLGEGDEVLLPAYHCESMVAPVRWIGAKPVFYKIHETASIDEHDLISKITSSTRAILVTHYFGFFQELESIVKYCQDRQIAIIEDCAHAFFAIGPARLVGRLGDYAIASSMKFFPVYDGGILASEKHDLSNVKSESAPIAFELKSFFRLLELSIEYRRLGSLGKVFDFLVKTKDFVWRLLKGSVGIEKVAKRNPASSDGGYGLDDEWVRIGESLCSRRILRYSNIGRIAQLRRQNYIRLELALSGLPNCRSLYSRLPDHVVPLVYPVFIENPESVFRPLKLQGVPIWRFGEFLDESVSSGFCENSIRLSKHVFQFPCHQELTDDELDWMIEKITGVMTDF